MSMELDASSALDQQPRYQQRNTFVSGQPWPRGRASTGTPLWGAGSSAGAVGQQTNEEAPGAAMRRGRNVEDDARRRSRAAQVSCQDNPANPPEPGAGASAAIPMLRIRNDRPANEGRVLAELLDPLEGDLSTAPKIRKRK